MIIRQMKPCMFIIKSKKSVCQTKIGGINDENSFTNRVALSMLKMWKLWNIKC